MIRDRKRQLIISFDITLQKELNLFFMAVKRSEFFTRLIIKGFLPSKLTKEEIEEMDEELIQKYSFKKRRNL